MPEKKQTVPIRWMGLGIRILTKGDGFSQDYRWERQGDVIEVAREDALALLTVPRTKFECVDAADLKAIEAEADAPAEKAPTPARPSAGAAVEPPALHAPAEAKKLAGDKPKKK